MKILIPDSWLREYLETKANPAKIAECLSLCGPSVEKVYQKNGETIYEIEVTTNRVDMMSVRGIAREAAAILPRFGLKAVYREEKPETVKIQPATKVEINDPQRLCRRIIGVVMDNVKLSSSPKFISQRLNAVAIRSLNNLIDITNYVMTETGQPTHVFDFDRIKTGKLFLRKAKKGEKIITLEDKEYELPGEDIVIDDGTGRIIDLPGIIGTANSVVTSKTKRILFFTENNHPQKIRNTSMKLGIRTVAATINEKDVDPELTKTAILKGISLFKKYSKARVASKIIDLYPNPYKEKTIILNPDRLKKYLGVVLSKNEVKNILEPLGFSVKTDSRDYFNVRVPSLRANDVSIPEDLIEEVARIYGYHHLPSLMPSGQLPPKTSSFKFNLEKIIKNTLVNWGFTETYTYSMQSQKQIEDCFMKTRNHLKITNPLSEEWVYLRRSLVPSLLSVINQNQDLSKEIKIFELSNVYPKIDRDLPEESPRLTLVTNGKNYLILKGIIEALCKKLSINETYKEPYKLSAYWKSGSTAAIFENSKNLLLGFLGEIKPEATKKFGLKDGVFVANLDFKNLLKVATNKKTYTPIARFPPVIEDFTFVVKPKTYLQNLIQLIKKSSLIIKSVALIDHYKDSRTLRVTYQNSKKNLTEKEVKKIRENIIERAKTLGATLKEKV